MFCFQYRSFSKGVDSLGLEVGLVVLVEGFGLEYGSRLLSH